VVSDFAFEENWTIFLQFWPMKNLKPSQFDPQESIAEKKITIIVALMVELTNQCLIFIFFKFGALWGWWHPKGVSNFEFMRVSRFGFQ